MSSIFKKNNDLESAEFYEAPERAIKASNTAERKKHFYDLPTSPATDMMMRVLSAGTDVEQMPARAKAVNHSQEIEVLQNGKARQVVVKNDVSTVTIELSDIERMAGSNKTAKKMLNFILIKVNEQAFSDRALRRNYVQFPLQELIDIGYYSRPQSARRGFNSAMDILTSLKAKGTIRKGKRKKETQSAIEVLFTGANVENATCTVYINERINWNFIAAFYTILPKCYFRLPNRASDLLYYIFYVARQRTKELEERSYFTIGLKSIQERLQLPSIVGNINPQRTIRDPIDDAIKAINKEIESKDFKITLICDNNAPIASFLSNGYLKVELKGIYSESFIELAKEKEKAIQTAKKRSEAITDKAIATNLAKKMESKDSSKKQTEKAK